MPQEEWSPDDLIGTGAIDMFYIAKINYLCIANQLFV